MSLNLRMKYATALKEFVETESKINSIEERIEYYHKQIPIAEESIKKLREKSEPLAEKIIELKAKLNAVKNG